jgi:hypothetical protein
MAKCEMVKKRPFFNDNMAEEIMLAGIFKRKYCLGDKTDCAR